MRMKKRGKIVLEKLEFSQFMSLRKFSCSAIIESSFICEIILFFMQKSPKYTVNLSKFTGKLLEFLFYIYVATLLFILGLCRTVILGGLIQPPPLYNV